MDFLLFFCLYRFLSEKIHICVCVCVALIRFSKLMFLKMIQMLVYVIEMEQNLDIFL